MIEGSGSGSKALTNGSGSGSRRPKNNWIRWIRIRNTAAVSSFLVRQFKQCFGSAGAALNVDPNPAFQGESDPDQDFAVT